MKNKPLITGVIALISPIPLFIFSVLWCWICFFGIGMGLLGYDSVPVWLLFCSLLPFIISLILGAVVSVGGIVHGCIKIKQKRAWLGILFSVMGLVENILLICFIIYAGRF